MGNKTHFHTPVNESGVVRQAISRPHGSTDQARCLVVSSCPLRRAELQTSARDAGWEPIVCDDADSALTAARRLQFRLAWVDTDSFDNPADGLAVCQSIAWLDQVLLAICGREGDAEEEIWARQLGVWLYLPGLAIGHGPEIQMLCEQAFLMTSRLQATC